MNSSLRFSFGKSIAAPISKLVSRNQQEDDSSVIDSLYDTDLASNKFRPRISTSRSTVNNGNGRTEGGESSDDDNDESPSKYSGPLKQLWKALLAKDDINMTLVRKQLSLRSTDLSRLFLYYCPNQAFSEIRIEPNASLKDKLIVEFANKFQMELEKAGEIFAQYILFEYNGIVSNMNELLGNDSVKSKVWNELETFYKMERICKLYCVQIVLGFAPDENHPYNELFTDLIVQTPFSEWCRVLCDSLTYCLNDEERTQALHTLSLFLYSYSDFEDVMEIFVACYHPPRDHRISREVLLAEAVLMFAFLQTGDEDKDNFVKTYMDQHGADVKENKYLLAAYIGAFKTRCHEQSLAAVNIRAAPQPYQCVKNMVELLNEYNGESYRDKHGISTLLIRSACVAAKIILGNFKKELFGSSQDWMDLFCALMKDPSVVNDFIRMEQPLELCQLFDSLCLRFPVDPTSILDCWGSLLGAPRNTTNQEMLLDQLYYIAEIFESIDESLLRPKENQDWLLLRDRSVSGVLIKAGTTGTLLEASDITPAVIVWDLVPSGRSINIWKYYLESKIKYAASIDGSRDTPHMLQLQICSIASFIIKSSKYSAYMPPEMFLVGKCVLKLLQRYTFRECNVERKCELVALNTNLLHILSAFDRSTFLEDGATLWPLPGLSNQISHLIVSYESVTRSDIIVTKAFLKAMVGLFRQNTKMNSPFDISGNMDNEIAYHYSSMVHFLRENILPSFLRWRIPKEKNRHIVFQNCLRVFINLFNTSGGWTSLKDDCCIDLINERSPLVHILKTDEIALQEAMVRPNEENFQLPRTVHLALCLVVKLVNYKRTTLHRLDSTIGLAIVQKLGRMIRHRINVNIPILAMTLLRKFAEETAMSILSCLGVESESFRDLVFQRLLYKSEDPLLKVVILEFLSVCAQTQSGLIGNFLSDNAFIPTIVEHIDGNDGNIVVSACKFLRALVKKNNSILKRYRPTIWGDILNPLKSISAFLNPEARKKIISTILNILSFEIFNNGFSDDAFVKELHTLLSEKLWASIVQASLEGRDDETFKCVLGLKHFLTVLCANPRFNSKQYEKPLQLVLSQVTDEFWYEKDLKESSGDLRAALAETMLLLVPSKSKDYLELLTRKMAENFFEDVIGVQIPLLACVNKCVKLADEKLSPSTVENILKLVAKLFESADLLFSNKENLDSCKTLLSLAARIVGSICHRGTQFEWNAILQRNCTVQSLLRLIERGLLYKEIPDILIEALATLIKLSKNPETSDLIRKNKFTTCIWIPALSYTAEQGSQKWQDVYLYIMLLNTVIIQNQGYYFSKEALSYWSLHGDFLYAKLCAITESSNNWYFPTSISPYHDITSLIAFNTLTCKSIAETLMFYNEWRTMAGDSISRLMHAILAAVQTCVKLVSDPINMILMVSKITTKPDLSTNAQIKLTPQILELQRKVWDFLSAAVSIYWKIKSYSEELMETEKLLSVLYGVMEVGFKALSKQPDRKFGPDTSKIKDALQKCLTIVVYKLQDHLPVLERMDVEPSGEMREYNTEITSICDGFRRVLPSDDLASPLCAILERAVCKPST